MPIISLPFSDIINSSDLLKKYDHVIERGPSEVSSMRTQAEKYGLDPARKHRKSTENGSSIPVNGSGVRIYPVPLRIDRNPSKPAAGYGHRNTASVLRRFPVFSRRKR